MNNDLKHCGVARIALAAVLTLCLAACSEMSPDVTTDTTSVSVAGVITDERIRSHDDEPGAWLAHGRTYDERRFSPLTTINRDNVDSLGLAWKLDLGTKRSQESTPIVVDGVMYFSSTWSRVYAVDAVTGEVRWKYDPHVPGEWARRLCCDVVNRGVAVYQGRVYVGTLDGRLVALDAGTGEQVWEVDTLIDRDHFYSITGAPRVANGKVYIGNGGAEFGVRGYVTAYDADTGDEVWRFFTVPGDPGLPFEHPELEAAAKTWAGGEWWEIGGGGTVWNSIVYDADLNQLYIGTGNGSPWARNIRSPGGGDNLYLSSIVALDPDTGRMKWYYQTTPGENWDYTATQDMALAEMEIDGEQRKVLLQAPKNGFFYVLDRTDGSLLRAHPYTAVTWASHVDMDTGRPVERPGMDYGKTAKWVLPGSAGGHNWHAMATDVKAGLVYIPTQQAAMLFALSDEWKSTGKIDTRVARWKPGIELGRLAQLFANFGGEAPPVKGALVAFDPISGETRWQVEQPHATNGGVLATAGGLVFQGDAEGMLSAYNKANGEKLWAFDTHTSIVAPPISYSIEGTQYVAILTGSGGSELWSQGAGTASYRYGNHGRLLIFRLDGDAKLPAPKEVDHAVPAQIDVGGNDASIAQGERLYNNFCAACHGLFVRASSGISDLRIVPTERQPLFTTVVLDGTFAAIGMAAFDDMLTEDDVLMIHQYVRARAQEDQLLERGEKDVPRLTWIESP
jgi:quinohemoprotein ethanol dehydrogenase